MSITDSVKNLFSSATGIVVMFDPLSHPDPNCTGSNSLDIPGYRQTDAFSCGFVAGLMVLHHFYPRRSLNKFYNEVDPNEDYGVESDPLASALRRSKIKVTKRSTLTFLDIVKFIDNENLVLTCITKGDYEHWVVIYGYSQENNSVYIAGNNVPYIAKLLNSHEMKWSNFKKILRPKHSVLICSK